MEASIAIRILIHVQLLIPSQVVTYEGNQGPEDVGWSAIGDSTAVQSIEDGQFVQFLRDPGQDMWQRSLADFAGGESFFVEWRVRTDYLRSLIDLGSAVVLLGPEDGAIVASYGFDMAIGFARMTAGPTTTTTDRAPTTWQTHRLELYADELYVWYVKGQPSASGGCPIRS